MTFIWLAVIIAVVFLDQLTKYLTVLYLQPVGTHPIIQDALHLTYVENPGAAFGMLANSRWVFMVISSVAIVAILVYLVWKKPRNKWECVSLAFIIGGGIGNMIDRVSLGYVVDMIDFRIINFAVFNVADSFVCVGAGILMVYLLVSMYRETKQERLSKAVVQATVAVDPAQETAADGSDTPAADTPAADTPDTPADASEESHD